MDCNVDLRVHRYLSLLSGICYPMPENYDNRSKCFRFAWKFYVRLAYALMFIELISQSIQIISSIKNVEVLTTCTLSTVYVVQFLLKILVFKKNEKTFDFVFNEMIGISESLMENPLGDKKFLTFYNKHYVIVKKIGIYKGVMQLASNLALNILFCVLSWVGMKREITAAFSWTPYDASKNPGYTFTCLFEMLCYGSVTARSGALDLLFWVMIIIPGIQLNYMKHLLGIILKDCDGPGLSGGKRISNGFVEDDLSSKFFWWIRHHQRVLGMIRQFEGLASMFLAVNYLASLVDLFMSGFVAISSSHWDIFQRVLINAIIITDAFQLYVVSVAGDVLHKRSEEAADYGLTSVLFRGEKSIRKIYLFVLTRAKKQIQIRFGGVNPLSSQTFLRLIQLTMTFFITILQIRSSKLQHQSQN